jgi:hypothetical protein
LLHGLLVLYALLCIFHNKWLLSPWLRQELLCILIHLQCHLQVQLLWLWLIG